MRVLIVKVSSLGDVIHTLPAVTEAKRANRRLKFDWVVEENFVEVPSWHPAVERVIPVAFRRWRKHLTQTLRSGEFSAFRRDLQATHYDLVIDAQGLIKSGFIGRLSRGLTVGLSNSTIKEPMATLFYNKVYSVPRDEHAVQRVRELFSRTLNYAIEPVTPDTVDYGIDLSRLGVGDSAGGRVGTPISEAGDAGAGTLLFLHGTTWQTKHWPDQFWRELALLATTRGYRVALPWGSEPEHQRAITISAGIAGAMVLPRQTLTGMARHIAMASGVVAVDTGLGHLAAALGTPTVSLYGPTNPGLAGTFGRNQRHLVSAFPCAPCMSKKCLYEGPAITATTAAGPFDVQPPCFHLNPPDVVLHSLEELVGQRAKSIIPS